ELLLAALQSQPIDRSARGGARPRQPVDASDEFEVFAYRQVFIEAEALRHIADARLDLVGFLADVVAEAGAGPLVRRQKPAQHADCGRFARSVGPKEAVDR